MKFLSAAGAEQIRLDKFLSDYLPDLSRTQIKKIIQEGLVQVNQTNAKPSLKLEGTESITYHIPELDSAVTHIEPESIPLDILYDDDDIIIINKQPGVVIHPGAGNYEKTIVNALLYRYQKNLSSIGGKLRPGIVHRIDKDTSGVIVVAKNDNAHLNLSKQFSNHTI